MKARNAKVITPVWAQKIEVDQRGNSLRITGWGHLGVPIGTHTVPKTDQSRLDIFRQFHLYGLRSHGKFNGDARGIYQFADADSDDKLIAFCKKFGPVWGRVESEKYEGESATSTVTVRQRLSELQAERTRFLSAVKLLRELNKNGRADYMNLIEQMAELGIDKANLASVHMDITTKHKGHPNLAALLPIAHWVLCSVLNKNLPRLTPINGEVVELPEIRREGIRNALYFQLRLDYMAQRTIGICVNCGSHFSVFRRGTRGCNEACQRALRNRKYWEKNKKAINKERRADRRGEE